jgi:hypothetical protein
LPTTTGPQPATGDFDTANGQWGIASGMLSLAVAAFESIIADKNEDGVIGLSRIMGLRMHSKVVYWAILSLLATCFVILPLQIVIKVIAYPATSWSIYLLGFIVQNVQGLLQTVFFTLILGPVGAALWGLILPLFFGLLVLS